MRVAAVLVAATLFAGAAAAAPIPPGDVIARAMTSSNVVVSWSPVSAVMYQVLRSESGTAFTLIGTTATNSFNDTSVVPDTAYLYCIRSVDGNLIASGDSNYSLATTAVFVDPSLAGGTTFIKAVHFNQLRAAVNAVRTLAGIGTVTFTPDLTPGATIVAASHLTDLRDALDGARSALTLPPLSYTDPTITSGDTPIRTAHILELREGVNGPLRCNPGAGTCNANISTYCTDDGMSLLTETCDPVQGMSCNGTTGRCDGSCSLAALPTPATSNAGCDFYPTVTANSVAAAFHFAVAISNANPSAATITITQGATPIATTSVPASSTIVQQLPWVASLKGPEAPDPFPGSLVATQGAYRLRSTLPVTVTQFAPVENTDGVNYSYSSDASMLFPAHAWRSFFDVMARNHWETFSGFYAVTAKEDNTVVTTIAPASLTIKSGSPLPTSGSGTVTLNAGDVLEIVSDGSLPSDPSDVTGTLIRSTKAVQVIGGHQCTAVPYNVAYCNHLEESVPPLDFLSTSYLVAAPWIAAGTVKIRRIRIVAITDTSLLFDPPQAGFPSSLLAGQIFDSGDTAAAFGITATTPVLVSEFMTGQTATPGNLGDPSMTIAAGTDRYLSSYRFFAPTTFDANFINIVAPAGTAVTLDGTAVAAADFSAIGSTGYSLARESLSNAGTGEHEITASAPVGVTVYGTGNTTTYWYPAGLRITP